MSIHLSVREIVLFVLRQGSIDSRFISAKRALEGVKLHNKIQAERAAHAKKNKYSYESEVSFKYEFEYNSLTFEIEGRCDGLIIKDGGVTIEELKSTAMDISEIAADFSHWHFAQVKFYGFLYCTLNNLKNINIMLTYCELETLKQKSFEQSFTYEQLKEYFFEIFNKYYKWLKQHLDRLKIRDETIGKIKFPHEAFRKGQRELAAAVYKTLVSGKKLFAGAPTGTGKTISTLFPSVKYIKNRDMKLFYLTAKNSTANVAAKSAQVLIENGLKLIALVLTSKEKICPEECNCAPVWCRFANGHFDRINEALNDILTNEYLLDRRIIEEYARKHTVCPHEFALELTDWVDLIICDYNYAFDPKASLKNFFSENASAAPPVLLIDEVHNLVDRSREMFSASLSKSDFSEIRKEIKSLGISKITKKFNEYRDSSLETSLELPEEFLFPLMNFIQKTDIWLSKNEGHELNKKVLDVYFKVYDFINIAGLFSEAYAVLYERNKQDLKISLNCLDSSGLLKGIFKKTAAAVLFSATLTPVSYYSDVLGGDDKDNFLRMPSPFKQEHLCILINNTISTKFKDRRLSYDTVAGNIYSMVTSKKGNYLAFFSSYEYLNNVFDIFSSKYPMIKTLVQKQSMTNSEREDYLSLFSAENQESLLGFAVLGSSFSEGIDLTGDRLLGVCVVGVSLPLISPVRNMICDYYNGKNYNGFQYAYINPGMNKVMQAAGRVIRTESDRGVLLLIDERFLYNEYRNLFPYEWGHYKTVRSNADIMGILMEFWSSQRGS